MFVQVRWSGDRIFKISLMHCRYIYWVFKLIDLVSLPIKIKHCPINTGSYGKRVINAPNQLQMVFIHSALLALCEGNPSVTGVYPLQSANDAGFDVSFDVSINKLLNKQSICRWIKMHRHSFDTTVIQVYHMMTGCLTEALDVYKYMRN